MGDHDKNIPEGHPHTWTDEQDLLYDAYVEPMPIEEWKAVDNMIYSRQHNEDECDYCSGTISFDTVEGEVVELAEVIQDSFDPALLAYHPDNFDPASWFPHVRVEDWSNEMWDAISDAWLQLPSSAMDAVWTAISDWEKSVGAQSQLDNKSVHDLSDAEWAQFCANLEPDYGITKLGDLVDDAESKPATADPKPPCECDGPPNGKYSTHLPKCPWYEKPKGGTYSYVSKSCKHNRDEFQLEAGLTMYASAYRDVKYLDDAGMDLGVYLYSGWQPDILTTPGLLLPFAVPQLALEAVYIDWPDFGVVAKDFPICDLVRWVLDNITAGKKVETGCMGGHGRTGTMLACVLAAQGIAPPEAVKRVRETYCEHAIESNSQVEFIGAFYALWHGNTSWKKSKKLRKAWGALTAPKYPKGGTSTWGKGSGSGWSGYQNGSGIINYGSKLGGGDKP